MATGLVSFVVKMAFLWTKYKKNEEITPVLKLSIFFWTNFKEKLERDASGIKWFTGCVLCSVMYDGWAVFLRRFWVVLPGVWQKWNVLIRQRGEKSRTCNLMVDFCGLVWASGEWSSGVCTPDICHCEWGEGEVSNLTLNQLLSFRYLCTLKLFY